MTVARMYFELYNNQAISLVNVIYGVYMRICDVQQIRIKRVTI